MLSSHAFPVWVRCSSSPMARARVGHLLMSARLCATASMGKGNFFAFFDLPKGPVMDVAQLQKQYHAIQRDVHPDRESVNAQTRAERDAASAARQLGGGGGEGASTAFRAACTNAIKGAQEEGEAAAVSGPAEIRSTVDVSTYANVAYEVLKDPFRRCRYLARLEKAQEAKGPDAPPLTPAEEEALLIEDDRKMMQQRLERPNRPLSEDFLMEMLMMNELIFAGDRADEATIAQMKVLLADLKDRDVGYFKDVQTAWAGQDKEAFYSLVEEWTYVTNALMHLKDRL